MSLLLRRSNTILPVLEAASPVVTGSKELCQRKDQGRSQASTDRGAAAAPVGDGALRGEGPEPGQRTLRLGMTHVSVPFDTKLMLPEHSPGSYLTVIHI